MSYVTLNSLDMGVSEQDGFDRGYADVESFGRSEGLTLEGTMYREVREFSFTVPVVYTDQEIQALRGWVKGRGHYFNFERVDGATTRFSRYSNDGGPGFGAGTTAGTATFAKYGTWCLKLPGGDDSVVTAGFGSEDRYSVCVWKRESGGTYRLCTVVADGTSTTSYSGATGMGATTAFSWWTVTAASGSLSVRLFGKNEAGTTASAFYDGLLMVPYALTTPQLEALNGRTTALPTFPYVELDGLCLEDLQPMVVKGTVASEETEVVNYQGAVTFIRVPSVRLVQR